MKPEYVSVACVNEQRGATDRRSFNWKTIVYATLYRRRSGARRLDESFLLHSDTLCNKSILVTMLVVSLSLLDALLTTQLLSRGAVELNPIMDYYIRRDLATFVLLKTLLTGACVLILVALANHRFLMLFKTAHIVRLVVVSYLSLIVWEAVLFTLL